MLYIENDKFVLSSTRVRYIQHGEEIEQYVTIEGIEWWKKFEEMWDHTEIIEFTEVQYSINELNRLKDIEDKIGLGIDMAEKYVKEGSFF